MNQSTKGNDSCAHAQTLPEGHQLQAGEEKPKILPAYYNNNGKENWYLKKKKGDKLQKWKNKMSNGRSKFKPHFGVETLSSLTTQFQELADFANVQLPDDLIRKVEGIVALLLNLQNCSTYQHFTSAVFLYIRDFYDTSITSQVMEYVNDLFTNGAFQKQSGDGSPNWLTMVRDLQTNWTLVKGNRAFKQFSKLLSILVTLGLCDVSSLKFDLLGFKLFDEDIMKKHMSAYDLADALLGTVTYFVEGAYLCFKTQSIKPLLLNDFSAMELDQEYTNVLMWWDLVKNGNLERIVGMSDSEFGNHLRVLTLKLSNLMTTLSGLDKKIVSDKVTKLKLLSNDLVTMKISSGTRRSPFAIELFGDSNQGKTTFGDQLVDALLISSNLPIDKEYRAALNPGDKFFSNWTSDKLVAILDDMANEKSQFVERPPTRAIIDICNNQMYYAPKAELEAKGKCFVEPEIVLVTTNKKDLDAYAYSNCPYSIQRRMDLVMTVVCKPEFQRVVDGKPCGVDSTLVREHYTVDGQYTPPIIDDIWLITIEKAKKPEVLTGEAKYSPILWRGKVMENISAKEAIQCAIEHMEQHRLNQFALMDHMRERSHNLVVCPIEGCKHIAGMCPDHSHDKQFGLQTAIALEGVRRRIVNRVTKDSESLTQRIESAVTKNLYKQTTRFLERWDWMCLVPSECLENETFIDVLHWYYKEDLEKQTTQLSWSCFILCAILAFFNLTCGLSLFLTCYLVGYVISKSRTKQILLSELHKRNDALPLVIKNARDGYAKALCYTCAGVAALYAVARVYKAWKTIQDSQGSLEPKTPEEVSARDAETNVWSTISRRSLPTSIYSDSLVISKLEGVVDKNLLYASINDGKQTLMANIFMLSSDMMLLPDHYFEESETLEVTCRKVNPNTLGGKFTTRLCLDSSVRIPDTDLRVCFTGSGGSYRNLIKYLPTGDISDHPFRIMWRKIDGEMLSGRGMARARKETTNGTCVFKGGEYENLTFNTFGGMCGAVVMSDTKSPCITGFHLGGQAGTPYGCFGTITAAQVEKAIAELKQLEGVLLTGNAGVFSPQAFGVTVTTNEPLHPKSALNYLPSGSQFAYYGSCLGAVSSRSDVRKTPISESLTELTGVENIWGPPKMRPEWFGWQTCLANASEPGKPFPHKLLSVAVVDYKKPLLELITDMKWYAKPLTDQENLCGIPGCKFVDSINLNTSIGYPLTGAKRKFVEELEPTDENPNNRVFTQEVMDEIARVEAFYLRGERAFTIAKACKKDEILPIAKEKCRIFYGNPIALTFLVRRYFLPVLRMLQMNPLKSECAVGINSHGPEWDQLCKHTLHYGKDRMFGGDYGKYDQKLPSQLLHAALRVLIDLARRMGYSDTDCETMAAMSGDLVYSLVACNGDLIGLTSGTHISGNSLTAVLNGICGSLNLRCFFYTQYPSTIPFRSAAHMMTYGDDNIGSVSPQYPKFNIKGCSEFLADYGQVYTMPDKESELKEYLDEDEFEFLKRSSVYHPKLGVQVGALAEKSIFKSLHCYMRPKGCPLTPEEACAQNIDGALREWFNHGQETYEKRRAQMRVLASKHELDHMVPMLNETYEDRIAEWHCRYNSTPQETKEHVYDKQSGAEYEASAFDEICQTMPLKCIARNAIMGFQDFGEVDLIFMTTLSGVNYYVIVEVKASKNGLAKGKQQVLRQVTALQILQPRARFLGIVSIGNKWHPVTIVGSSYSDWFLIAEKGNSRELEEVIAMAILDA